MNIIYFITPVALLAAFAGYVVPASARLDAALATRAAAEEQRLAVQHRDQETQRQIAAAEQERRTAERIRLQAQKERDAHAAQERRDRDLSDNLAQAQAAREALRGEISTLEARLQHLTTERDRAGATLHTARATLETRLIERRNTDLELQRMTLLLAELVDASFVTGESLFPSPGQR